MVGLRALIKIDAKIKVHSLVSKYLVSPSGVEVYVRKWVSAVSGLDSADRVSSSGSV